MRQNRKPKASTYETLQFALELLKRIPRSHKVSARELAEQLTDAGFQRDLRTVQRQLDELSTHFDIERDERSKPYGYRWKERAQGLSVPGLNEKESLLLALAAQHLSNLLPAEVTKSLQPFFEQARRNLSPSELPAAARAGDWVRKVRVVSTSQPLLPPAIAPGVFDTVSTALYRDQWLSLSYRNQAGKETQPRVMPLGMAQQGGCLYLVCRYEGYENERSLALHRIQSATLCNASFERPPSFDLERYDDDGRFGFGEGKKIRLKVRLNRGAGHHLLESRLSEDQVVIENGDQYVITATVTKSAQLVWWLRGFGDEVQVLAPADLVHRVHGRDD